MVKINCGIDVPKIGDVENFSKKTAIGNVTSPVGIPGLEMIKKPSLTIESKANDHVT